MYSKTSYAAVNWSYSWYDTVTVYPGIPGCAGIPGYPGYTPVQMPLAPQVQTPLAPLDWEFSVPVLTNEKKTRRMLRCIK